MSLPRFAVIAALSTVMIAVACSSDDPPAGAVADAAGAQPATDTGVGADDAAPASDVLDAVDGAFADAAVDDASADDVGPASDGGPGLDDGGPSDGGPSDGGPGLDDGGPSDDAAPTADGGPLDATPTTSDGGPAGADAGNLCTSTADCIPNVEICGRLVAENNAVVSRCAPPNAMPNAQPIGGMCAADNECSSNLCLDGLANECTVVCGYGPNDCPAGFTCAAYQYTPGNVWIPTCGRTCADDDDCAGTTDNVCSTQTYLTPAGPYELAQVCQTASGTVAVGGRCASGNDCRSGICFTNTRAAAGCAACGTGEVCQCTGGGAPPCAGGVMPDCVLRACTALCDDPTDCAAGGPLTRCAPAVNLRLPDGQTRPISACARP